MNKYKIIILPFLILFLLSSCIIVKNTFNEDAILPKINLSPKPEIEMSDEIVRSPKGDVIAFIPKDWFFVNIEEEASSDIIAMAVNPDYTAAAVFSSIRKTNIAEDIYQKDGLIGLARMSFDKRQKKSGGTVILNNNYNTLQIGALSFAKYEFSSPSINLISKTVVFKTEFDEYYEFSLIPMNITGKPLPDNSEFEKIFRSILSTIQY
jgi:hypothetical protein